MEEEKNKDTFNISDESKFKKSYTKKEKSYSFGKTVVIPFISGIVGTGLVIGTCFGVPSVKNKILSGTFQNTSYTSATSSDSSKELINLSDFSNTSTAVAQNVLPSVVGITVNYQINSIFGSTTGKATGSGIIISEDGYILTNNHVISSESSSSYYAIESANGITINLYNDSTEYTATVVGTDPYTDLAVLKIDATGLTAATLGNSDDVKVGEYVLAIGNPVGMDYTVTGGIISATNREVTVDGTTYYALQTDAAINSGNSGGALVNTKGEVIGINTLKLSGNSIEGIGFSIPISSTTNIVDQLIKNKTVKRPYIGIASSVVTSQISTRYHIPEGVYIEKVEENTSASKSGLQVGDIITKINGTEIKTTTELNRIKNTFNIGDTVTLTIYRENEYKEIKVELQEEPENASKTTTQQNQVPSTGTTNNGSIFDLFR